MTKPVRVFWDLDKTLLDTDALLGPVLADLSRATGMSEPMIADRISALDQVRFTWHLLYEDIGLDGRLYDEMLSRCGAQYGRAEAHLYPGALEAVEELAPIAEQVLVTFGDRDFQRRKWRALPSLRTFFHSAHFVDGATIGKGALIATYDPDGRPSVFVDDSKRWQVDCARHAPHVTRVHMRYAPGAFADILSLVRRLAG